MMSMDGELRSRSIIAAMLGIGLTLVIVASVVVLPVILQDFIPGNPGDPPVTNLSIGARIARYLDTRTSEILFGFSYNSSFVNANISEIVQDYVDGFIIYGAPMTEAVINLTIIHVTAADSIIINVTDFITVADSFETAMAGINNTAATINESLIDNCMISILQRSCGTLHSMIMNPSV